MGARAVGFIWSVVGPRVMMELSRETYVVGVGTLRTVVRETMVRRCGDGVGAVWREEGVLKEEFGGS